MFYALYYALKRLGVTGKIVSWKSKGQNKTKQIKTKTITAPTLVILFFLQHKMVH